MDIGGKLYKKLSKLVNITSEQIQDLCDEPQSSSASNKVSSQAEPGPDAIKNLVDKICDSQNQALDKSIILLQEKKQQMLLRNKAVLALQEQLLAHVKQLEQMPQPDLGGDN